MIRLDLDPEQAAELDAFMLEHHGPKWLLDKLHAGQLQHEAEVERERVRAEESARTLWPLLLLAEREGTYVRAAYVALATQTHGRYVVPASRETLAWSPAIEYLKARGHEVQMVVRGRDRGVSVQGYRIRPTGDDRESVEERDVWREGGHCVHCGITADQAIRDHCISAAGVGGWARGHEFSERVRA